MTRFFLVFVVLLATLLACPALAQEPPVPATEADLRALVDKAGSREENGGADLVTVFRRTDVAVEPSGLSRVVTWELLKVLSEKGASDTAELRLDYDPASNEVEILSVRLLRKDGPCVDIPPAAAEDLPQPQDAIYWGVRMKRLPIPRPDPGDAVEIRTASRGFVIAYLGDEVDGAAPVAPAAAAVPPAPGGPASPSASSPADERFVPPMRGHFYDLVTFQDRQPTKLRSYVITTPKDKPLQYEVYNGELQSDVTWDTERIRYAFWKQDVPAWKDRAYGPGPSDVSTRLVLSTIPDWKARSRWFYQVNVGQFEADDAIRARVRDLVRGKHSDEERIAAIVHWAADEIRYAGVSMGHGEGYTLHSGTMVYEDRAGVCKDKASMAITMLRAAGFTVYPAMTLAGGRVERIPADPFNHCVAALKKSDGSFMLVDPTWVVLSPELWSSAEGEQQYLVGTPEGEVLATTPAFRAEDNALVVESDADLDTEGTLSGTLLVWGRGTTDQRLRRELRQSRSASERQAFFETLVADIGPGAVVEPVALRDADLEALDRPLRLTVRYRIAHYASLGHESPASSTQAQAGRVAGLVFVPPVLRHPLQGARFAPYFEAATPQDTDRAIFLWTPRQREFRERITLPAGFSVAHLPSSAHLSGDAASLDVELSARGRRLEVSEKLVVKGRLIPVAAYPNLHEVVAAALAFSADPVVLERR
jgi:hypothetical protein